VLFIVQSVPETILKAGFLCVPAPRAPSRGDFRSVISVLLLRVCRKHPLAPSTGGIFDLLILIILVVTLPVCQGNVFVAVSCQIRLCRTLNP